ncbi:hypothetical protein BaRGS_00009625 [Batillaria attramentaria]|uniref:Uncharacterized protein n=1 Tax=Batillaria attramentaria TaxID=370345 RepID=A0ABD0LIV6_9CAEN
MWIVCFRVLYTGHISLSVPQLHNQNVDVCSNDPEKVWNLNNLDADVLHANEIIKGAVKSLAVSRAAGIVACHGGVQGQAEVKLVELNTGRVTGTLQQAAHVAFVSNVSISAGGRYILTSNVWAQDEDSPRENTPATVDWPLLRCMVLWDAEKQTTLFSQVNARYAFFDRHGSSLGVVHCIWYSPFDWADNLYRFSFLLLDSEVSCVREQHFNLPDHCEPVGSPVLFCDRRSHTWAFVSVLQMCQKTFTSQSIAVVCQFETVLWIKYITHGGGGVGTGGGSKYEVPEPTIIRLQDLIRYPDQKDLIANVTVVSTNLLLIVYVKNVEHFVFDSSRGLVVPPGVDKGVILYDLLKNVVVKHSPRVFDTVTNKMLCKVDADLHPGSVRLTLDGRYLVGLTQDQRALHIFRTDDGTHKGSLLIHGKATCVEVAEDGRTIAVGTCDGRIMLLSLVLEFSDPYCEHIQHLPSRNPPPPPALELDGNAKDKKKAGLLLDEDAQVIRGTTPELIRLSAKIRSDVKMAVRKQPSFRSITNAMVVAQKFQQSRSQACVIQ